MAEKIPSGYSLRWADVKLITSQKFVCWHCGNPLASEKGWSAVSTFSNKPAGYLCLCHYCQRPTFIDENDFQHPVAPHGSTVQDISDESVQALYTEARYAIGAGAPTAAVLACRKLLMHIAVSKGASEGLSFIAYVEYLSNNHYIPPDAKAWVDQIRSKGNEANHEILIISPDEAKELLSFTEMLLKIIYEFPAAIKRKNEGNAKG